MRLYRVGERHRSGKRHTGRNNRDCAHFLHAASPLLPVNDLSHSYGTRRPGTPQDGGEYVRLHHFSKYAARSMSAMSRGCFGSQPSIVLDRIARALMDVERGHLFLLVQGRLHRGPLPQSQGRYTTPATRARRARAQSGHCENRNVGYRRVEPRRRGGAGRREGAFAISCGAFLRS
jgi:hypothetical protein